MSNECPICCDTLNKSTKAAVTCELADCDFTACKTCTRKYLLGTTDDPNCMNCHKAWSQAFVVANLNRSFVTNEYSKHRKALLLEREISKLPETAQLAENEKLAEREEISKAKFHDERLALQRKAAELRRQISAVQSKEWQCQSRIHKIKNGTLTEKKKFIMPCPSNQCRGYLSSQYKCDLCELHTCSKCLEVVGYSKTDPHTCKEESIQSAELIKKDTKPCPSCGTRIFKITGCDQMWCTNCHNAFDWSSGRVSRGVVHNPHFYEHQRNTGQGGGGQAPRNPGDVLCGGLCTYRELTRIIDNIYIVMSDKEEDLLRSAELSKKASDLLMGMHRAVSHITNYSLRNIRTKVRTLGDSQKIRVDYILMRITKEEMGTKVYRNDNLRRKYTELLHVYELMSVVGIELFSNLSNSEGKNTPEFVNEVLARTDEYDKLRIYCNKQLSKISITYNQQVEQFSDKWAIEKQKFNISKKVAAVPAAAPSAAQA